MANKWVSPELTHRNIIYWSLTMWLKLLAQRALNTAKYQADRTPIVWAVLPAPWWETNLDSIQGKFHILRRPFIVRSSATQYVQRVVLDD